MKSSPDPQLLAVTLTRFLHRYHAMVFVIVIIVGLALANFMINQAINEKPAEPLQQTTTSFDDATMEKIDQLNENSSQQTDFTLPSGRINPFI